MLCQLQAAWQNWTAAGPTVDVVYHQASLLNSVGYNTIAAVGKKAASGDNAADNNPVHG